MTMKKEVVISKVVEAKVIVNEKTISLAACGESNCD